MPKKAASLISKDVLNFEYKEKKKTDKEIAMKYGFHEETIRRLRSFYGISFVKKSSENELLLTLEQKEIIFGSLMGDAYANCSGQIEITHCIAQYPYLYWLSHKLNSVLSDVGITFNPWKTKCRIRTKALDTVKSIRDELYPDGIKRPKSEFLERLTPLSLAIWYSDDGSLDNGCNCHIHTRGFTEKENEFLSVYFKNKWDISAKVFKAYSKRHAKTYYELVFDKENSIKLNDLIKFHMLPCMLYKILKSERDNIVYLAGAMQYHPDGGIKWRRNLKHALNKKGYYCIDPTREENNLFLEDDWKMINDNFDRFQNNFRKIINNDLYFVKMSGIIICHYDDFLGGGTFHEIGQSYLLNKKLYLINVNKKPLDKLSWWALGCCTKVVDSVEEVINELPDITKRPAYVHYNKSRR